MISINRADFLNRVFNFEEKEEWEFSGKIPCIIDFYDDSCPPCKAIEPLLNDLSQEYDGRVDFLKVDIKKEEKLARELGVTNLPTLVLCPIGDRPVVMQGVPTREKLSEAIEKELL
jgi:thioredoxin-like negative regulator of GroEL